MKLINDNPHAKWLIGIGAVLYISGIVALAIVLLGSAVKSCGSHDVVKDLGKSIREIEDSFKEGYNKQ